MKNGGHFEQKPALFVRLIDFFTFMLQAICFQRDNGCSLQKGQMIRVNLFLLHVCQILHDIFQLADISRPVVRLHGVQSFARQGKRRASQIYTITTDKCVYQPRNIFRPFSQRRQMNRQNIEPVIQVGPKPSLFDHLLQILICGGDDPDVDRDYLVAPYAHDLPLLQHPQQPILDRSACVPDFIEKNRPFVRQFKPADVSALSRPGKSSLLVAEELAFQKRFGNRGKVYADERLPFSRGGIVNGLCQQFLARSRFAEQQHGGIASGNFFGDLDDLLKGLAFAVNFVKAVLGDQAFAVQAQPVVVLHLFDLRCLPKQQQTPQIASFHDDVHFSEKVSPACPVHEHFFIFVAVANRLHKVFRQTNGRFLPLDTRSVQMKRIDGFLIDKPDDFLLVQSDDCVFNPVDNTLQIHLQQAGMKNFIVQLLRDVNERLHGAGCYLLEIPVVKMGVNLQPRRQVDDPKADVDDLANRRRNMLGLARRYGDVNVQRIIRSGVIRIQLKVHPRCDQKPHRFVHRLGRIADEQYLHTSWYLQHFPQVVIGQHPLCHDRPGVLRQIRLHLFVDAFRGEYNQ